MDDDVICTSPVDVLSVMDFGVVAETDPRSVLGVPAFSSQYSGTDLVLAADMRPTRPSVRGAAASVVLVLWMSTPPLLKQCRPTAM